MWVLASEQRMILLQRISDNSKDPLGTFVVTWGGGVKHREIYPALSTYRISSDAFL